MSQYITLSWNQATCSTLSLDIIHSKAGAG